MINIKEFFQDDNGSSSMGRLLLFGSFVVTSAIMLILAHVDKMSEGYMTIYIGTYAGAYAFSKNSDRMAASANITPQNP